MPVKDTYRSSDISSHQAYRADIDGLRAVAVLAVVIFHAFPGRLPGGFIGVDIFFVISGYLISGIIFSEIARNAFSLSRFYERRIRRIFPALFVVLVFCIVAGWFVMLADEYTELGKHVFAGTGFVLNLILWGESGYFDNVIDTKPLLHLWSLGVEEQFYIFWPLILGLGWKYKINFKFLIVAICVLSFALNMYQTSMDMTAAFYSPLPRFWELLTGALVAWWSQRNTITNRHSFSAALKNSASISGLLLVVSALFLINKDRNFPGVWALLPVFGAVLLVVAGPSGFVNRHLLSNRLMVGIGLISYPLYLWHWPLLSFARVIENQTPAWMVRLLLVLMSFVLAWATYVFIEKPIRQSNKNRNLFLYGLVISMLVASTAGYWIFMSNGMKDREIVKASLQTAPFIRIDFPPLSSCTEGLDISQLKSPVLQFCKRYSSAAPQKTIVLWGDSSALTLLPVFATIAKEKDYAIFNISHFSCPPILQARKTSFTFEASKNYCADGVIQSEILEFVGKIKPDLIIISAAWVNYGKNEFVTDMRNEVATQASTNRVLKARLPETIEGLTDIANVVIIKSWPHLSKRPRLRVIDLLGISKDEVTVLQNEFDQNTRLINQVFDNLTNRRLRFYSPANKLCDGKLCHSEVDGVLFYEDTYHLSSQGVMHFKDDLEIVIAESIN